MRQKAMALRHELQVLYHMLVAPIRGASHAERLESFYGGQAEGYDAFRARLLYGRRELWTQLPVPAHGIWVDMGGGTGANVLYVEAALPQLARLYIVDLSPSLLHVARQRIQAQGWTQVTAVEADATRFVPPEGPVDVVTFTYSLTMIPDWFAALDHAWEILRPGGIIGVVDFYVSRKYPTAQQRRHLWLTRAFWPLWFSFDNVFPSPDHVPYLHNRFEMQTFSEHTAPVPYLPGLRVPYYLFIGQKPAKPTDDTASSQPTDTMGWWAKSVVSFHAIRAHGKPSLWSLEKHNRLGGNPHVRQKFGGWTGSKG